MSTPKDQHTGTQGQRDGVFNVAGEGQQRLPGKRGASVVYWWRSRRKGRNKKEGEG